MNSFEFNVDYDWNKSFLKPILICPKLILFGAKNAFARTRIPISQVLTVRNFFHVCWIFECVAFIFNLNFFLSVLGSIYAMTSTPPQPRFLPTPTNVTFLRGELATLRCAVINLGTKYVSTIPTVYSVCISQAFYI